MGARAANAEIQKYVWEMPSVVKSLDAFIEWVFRFTFDSDVRFCPGLWRSWDV